MRFGRVPFSDSIGGRVVMSRVRYWALWLLVAAAFGLTACGGSSESEGGSGSGGQDTGVIVPDVTGLDSFTAMSVLTDQGFVALAKGRCSSGVGIVEETEPAIGASIEPGATVTVVECR